MPARLRKYAHRAVSALLCVAAIAAAGCHGPPNISYYGIAWVTMTAEPGNYTAYIVTVDSVTLTRNDGVVVTAVATPEIIDFTQIQNIAEMWSSEAVPTGTYVSASITLDYTSTSAGGSSVIAVMKNGAPVSATVLDYTTHAAATTYTVTVDFDAAEQPNITNTYASTSALLMNIDMDLGASGVVDMSTATPTVYVRPFLSIGHLPANNRLIRVRGPLINSSTDVQTYTVDIRPFYDEANNIGMVTLFSQPSTVYTLNGVSYLGSAGLDALSVLSAGTTMTAGFTTFQPDYNPLNQAYAGRFNLQYVVAGSTLEDFYTEGLSGDVISRTGNTLLLRGSTLFVNPADTFSYNVADAQVLLGPGTLVTADDNTKLTKLDSSSIAVGQHITARGIYTLSSTNVVMLDATGTSNTNTGSVRLQPSEVWGSLVSNAAGSLVMDASTINNWPVSAFDFAGNGATTPVASAFSVSTAEVALPAGTAVGDPIWVNGYTSPFGTAPPDFEAFALNNETSVQVAGGPIDGGIPTAAGDGGCGIGSQVCDPAVLQVVWSTTSATTQPFETASASGFALNLANASLASAVIQIGPESIEMKSLPSSPLIVPTALPITQLFSPRYCWGVPATATTTSTVTSSTALKAASSFATFIDGVNSTLSSSSPAAQLSARGIYDRATNTFTATSIDFVL